MKELKQLRASLQMPRWFATDAETLTGRYGRFSAQPFERGLGTTVGNSLRRALLSSIDGAAVTAVKIEGVEHEFALIKGVVEDVADVILNLKQVPFKLRSGKPKTLRISKEVAGEVTAADIEADSDVEILDPAVHIATVTEGGSLQVEMRLKCGRGYVSADRNFDEDLSLGYIPIDSVHTPVKKVNYIVEAARLGQNTEFDKLTIEVWTDGSVKPEDAIELAAKVMKDHMSIFINLEAQPSNDQLDRSFEDHELLGVREHLEEEAVARDYVTHRYRSLIDQKYLHGLSTTEEIELEGLQKTLDKMDKPYYASIIRRLENLTKDQNTNASLLENESSA